MEELERETLEGEGFDAEGFDWKRWEREVLKKFDLTYP
jgi:hypothetical protein